MRTPKRVRITSVEPSDDRYYEKYIGTEANVLEYFPQWEEIKLDIFVKDSSVEYTTWDMSEVEIVEWVTHDVDEYVNIMQNLQQSKNEELIGISKVRYNELLEYEKFYNEMTK